MTTPSIRGNRIDFSVAPNNTPVFGPSAGTWNVAPQPGDTIWAMVCTWRTDGGAWSGQWQATPAGWTLQATSTYWKLFKRTADGSVTDTMTAGTFCTHAILFNIVTVGESSCQAGAFVNSSVKGPVETLPSPSTLGQTDTLIWLAAHNWTHYVEPVPNSNWTLPPPSSFTLNHKSDITSPYNYAYDAYAMWHSTATSNVPPPISIDVTNRPASPFGTEYYGTSQAVAYIGNSGEAPAFNLRTSSQMAF